MREKGARDKVTERSRGMERVERGAGVPHVPSYATEAGLKSQSAPDDRTRLLVQELLLKYTRNFFPPEQGSR